MTIPQDVAAAADRLQIVLSSIKREVDYYGSAFPETLADFQYVALCEVPKLLALIATQQQQAAEREKPVDEEWLQSLERVDGGDLSMICVRLCDDGMLHIVVNGWVSPYHATRGELLDLLAALKIQAKGSE